MNDNDDQEKLIFFKGFEAALIGIGRQFNREFAVYDYVTCCAILIQRDGMSSEEAINFMESNVVGAYLGPKTPIFVSTVEEED